MIQGKTLTGLAQVLKAEGIEVADYLTTRASGKLPMLPSRSMGMIP